MRVDYNLDSREKWILRLLVTPNDAGNPEPIHGRTRVQKAMFLVQQKLREEFNDDAGFEFEPYKYGPFDHGVYDALERLDQTNLIEVTSGENHHSPHDSKRYELTEKGSSEAQQLWKNLSAQKQQLLRWVRYRQADRPLGSLLSYVYRQYPEMTTKSEIGERVDT